MCLQQCSPADASLQCMAVPQHSCTQMGRRRWPPPGGVQWNRNCQQRARFISNWLCPITAGQSRHSFEQFVRAIRSEVFFPLSFPFPRSLGTTANPTPKSGKVWFFRIFGRFFRLPNRAWKMISKKHRKKCENQGFWPPKPLPKLSQNRAFLENVDFWKIVLPPRRNCYFSGFGALETGSKSLKNWSPKRVVFQHRFFRVLASISEGLGLPRWSQVGYFGLQNLRMVPPKSLLKFDVF